MENLNKIDQFFKEENKKFEENISFPDFENVWGKIENRLDKTENKKKNIALWLPYSIAASLVITIGLMYFFTQKSENREITIASSNAIQKALNQDNRNSMDSVKLVEINQSIQKNIQKTIDKNQLVSKKYISNTNEMIVTPQPSIIASSYININDENRNVLSDEEMAKQTKNDSAIVLAANILEEKQAERNSALKMMKAKANAQSLAQENPSRLADATNDDLYTEQNRLEDVKIIVNKESQPLYIIDGYVADTSFLRKYNLKKITSLNIIEGENAVQLYGDYGKKGVVVMTTKGLSSKEKLLLQEKNINFNKN
jgi:Ca-activated chloride channel family protein